MKEGFRLLCVGLEICPEALIKCQGICSEIQKLSPELTVTLDPLRIKKEFI